MDTVEQRLETLEREVRRSRRANWVLVLAVLAIACMAGAQSDKSGARQLGQPAKPAPAAGDEQVGSDRQRTVEADRFVLLDRAGRPRATLVAAGDGPELSMFDEQGRKRLELKQGGASGLRLFDGDGSAVASLQLSGADSAQLEIKSPQGASVAKADGFFIRDADQQGRVTLALLNGNFPVLGISQSGQNGPPSIELAAAEGSRSIKLHDGQGFPLFSLSAETSGKTSLDLHHPAHERSLRISTGRKGSDGPTVAFFAPANRDGTGGLLPRLRLGVDGQNQPYLRLIGSNGQPVFAAPK